MCAERDWVIVRPGPDEWQTLRAARLQALEDAPYAFGSTLERELAFDEDTWRARLAGRRYVLAQAGTSTVGLAAGYREDGGPATERQLVSMWVDPQVRGTGVAADLVAAVAGWARADGASTLTLWVAVGNDRARAFYTRCGFVPTGATQPISSEGARCEDAMVLQL